MCCASECIEAAVKLTWSHGSSPYEASRILRYLGRKMVDLLRSNCASRPTALTSASALGYASSWCRRIQEELL